MDDLTSICVNGIIWSLLGICSIKPLFLCPFFMHFSMMLGLTDDDPDGTSGIILSRADERLAFTAPRVRRAFCALN
jgi:hypothetical protein